MTKATSDGLVIQREEDGICEACGKVAELRPYGPNGKNVCFKCGMKDEGEAIIRFCKRLDGARKTVVLPPEDEAKWN